ncbi:MAG: hypothetical protein V1834_00295 [Candidatus Micrarchaeota archaeon]
MIADEIRSLLAEKRKKPVPDDLELYLSQARVRNKVYRTIIDRYADAINEGEEKSIPELKTLVNPRDKTVVNKRDEFFMQLKGDEIEWQFDFDRDFPGFAVKSFEFVNSLKPVHAELSVSYWLSPKDMIDLGAGDALDKCVFLCSLLISAGCKNARVRVVALEGALKHSFVLFEFKNRQYLLDPSSVESEAVCEAEALEGLFVHYCFDSRGVVRPLYEFNDESFEEFEA